MKKFMVGLCPHGGAISHTPEDHWVSPQEICRQSCVQLATLIKEGEAERVRGRMGGRRFV